MSIKISDSELEVMHYVTLYTPNISEEEHVQSEGKNFINKLFGENDVDDLKGFFKMEDDNK